MKKAIVCKSIFVCYIIFTCSVVLSAQNDVRMLFKEPAKEFTASCPLGNGHLGAMVFGRTDTERIVLNEISMSSGNVQDADDTGAIRYLPQVRQLLLGGKKCGSTGNIAGPFYL